MNPLFSFVLAAKLLLYHPFHVSVCDIAYKSSDEHFKISVRLFLDDLETTMKIKSGDDDFDIMDRTDSLYFDQKIDDYIKENLTFEVSGQNLSYQYVGSEYDIDVLWCYFEVVSLNEFDAIQVKNTLLLEVFEDQENLVTLSKDGVSKSVRLNQEKTKATLTWE